MPLLDARAVQPVATETIGSKRHLKEEEDVSVVPKKRAVSSMSGSPVPSPSANGISEKPAKDEPEGEDEVELFRKAAIFRRMRQYARMYERTQQHLVSSEQKRRTVEARYMIIDACWKSILDTIHLLVQVEDLKNGGAHEDDVQDAFASNSFSHSDFEKVAKEKSRATKNVISAFAKLISGTQGVVVKDGLVDECQSLQQKNRELTAQLKFAMRENEELARDKTTLTTDLDIAHSRIDRLRSRILNPISNTAKEVGEDNARNEDDSEATAKMEVVESNVQVKRESPPLAASPINEPNSVDATLLEDLKLLVQNRERRISELERENGSLRENLARCEAEVSQLSENAISQTPAYRSVAESVKELQEYVETLESDNARQQEELDKLLTGRTSWEAEQKTTLERELNNHLTTLKKRDDDLNRLRQQRDSLETQLREAKMTNESKWSSIHKYKALADSRAERILVLNSEVQRVKARLASSTGHEDILQFLFNDTEHSMDYVNDLQKRLQDAEQEREAYRQTLQSLDKPSQDRAFLLKELESAKKRLNEYEAKFGASVKDKDLLRELSERSEELRLAKLNETQTSQELNALFSEVDRLSALWETLDKQVQTQAITLQGWEEERERLAAARARSDNKYYRIMSEAEVKDNERKQALRSHEKMSKVVDCLKEEQASLQTLIASTQEELMTAKQVVRTHAKDYQDLLRKHTSCTQKLSEQTGLTESYREKFRAKDRELVDRNMEKLKLQDELEKTKREMERAVERAKNISTLTAPVISSDSELSKQVEGYKRLLKCSTCNHAMRNTIITKCMHTFCKDCIDARISHRQRKCPACNLQFGQQDVQTFYLQ